MVGKITDPLTGMEMFEEHLLWILDDRKDTLSYKEEVPDGSNTPEEWVERNRKRTEEKIRKNIEFVRALGLKCDSVGWCSLDLNRPDRGDLLDRIRAFALKEGMYLRGYYTRWNADTESEWYLLESEHFTGVDWDYATVKDRNGNPLTISEVYACKIPKHTQVLWDSGLPCVHEKFRDCCLRNGFSGVDFYWIRDIGRYRAAQFFGLIIDPMVPEFACDRYLTYSDSRDTPYKNFDHSVGSPLYQRYLALGGALPKLSQMFYDLRVDLPVQLPRNRMPDADFAYISFWRADYVKQYALVRKRAAETLLAEKAIRKEYLTPVTLYDAEPEGYYIQASEPLPYPSVEAVRQLEADYEKLKQNPRPEKKAADKEALKQFRRAKRLRPEDFGKGLAGKARAALAATPHERLSPYYAVSDGGYLSDEYQFLPYAESVKETKDFAAKIAAEELLADRCAGTVIAKCADGDWAIVCDDGSVRRISHETMDAGETWDTVAQFFCDALSED